MPPSTASPSSLAAQAAHASLSATAHHSHISLPNIASFQTHLRSSKRVLALCGAGLSASSGLPTFRGAGGLWRTHDAMDLATMRAFQSDPALVWQFYGYRRHMALNVRPNGGHWALSELARQRIQREEARVREEQRLREVEVFSQGSGRRNGARMPRDEDEEEEEQEVKSRRTPGGGFLTLTQNVDGLSQRAGHPLESLLLLHGSLFDVKCSSFFCSYVEINNFRDPIVPALALPTREDLGVDEDEEGAELVDITRNDVRNGVLTVERKDEAKSEELDISLESTPLPDVPLSALPHCPNCQGLLRPGVVWFGERLPPNVIDAVDDFIGRGPVDLIMVIGTSASVYPAAGYVSVAKHRGAKVCVINAKADLPAVTSSTDGIEGSHEELASIEQGGDGSPVGDTDWFFKGDAAVLLPQLLRGEIGDMPADLDLMTGNGDEAL